MVFFIILVIVLCIIKNVKGLYFRNYGGGLDLFFLKLGNVVVYYFLFGAIFIKGYGPVLGTLVRPLPV